MQDGEISPLMAVPAFTKQSGGLFHPLASLFAYSGRTPT